MPSHAPRKSRKFAKPPPWLVEVFDEALAGTSAERRQMFGCPVGFANGQLFTGVFGAGLFVRLDEPDRAELLARAGAEPFDPLGGRPMRQYVMLPREVLEDVEDVRGWMRRAQRFVLAMPHRAPKASVAQRNKTTRRPL
jgi:TfoX N-terminal domain